jgi:hypothetical protein
MLGQALASVLAFELLTGTTVFGADPVAEIEAHLSQRPMPPRCSRPEVPDWLDERTRKLLAKAPGDRPADARSVLARLLPSVANLPALPGIIRRAAEPSPSQLYMVL